MIAMSKKIRTITRPLYSVRGVTTARKTPPMRAYPVAALCERRRTRCKHLERALPREAATAAFGPLVRRCVFAALL